MDSREIRDSNEIDLMDYIRPLVPRWKLLLLAFIIGGTAAFLISSVMPKKYRSTAVVFVQQSNSAASLLKNLPIPVNGAGGTSSGYITAVLQSDSMHISIIKKLDLLHNKILFKKPDPSMEEALDKMSKLMNVTEGKSGTVTITVVTGNPYLAERIANTAVDLLGSFVVTASQKKADFTEKKLKETAIDLDKAEDDLKDFMEHNDVASVDDQTKGMILQLGELDSQVLSMQAELEGIVSQQQNAADLDSLAAGEVRRKSLEASLDYVRKQRDELKAKLAQLPEIGAQYARIQRRVLVLSKTYEQLNEQYQIARVTQKGEDGDYQIIDRARPNRKHISPRRMVNSVAGAFAAFILAAFIIAVTQGTNGPTHTTRPITRSVDRGAKPGPVSRV